MVLIETLWNVNEIKERFYEHSSSFNRNIVECKFALVESPPVLWQVLIETLWNVNSYMFLSFSDDFKVLIETLWNVNHKRDSRDLQR